MLKYKKILLSLSLCLILLTGSVFATTMSESDIKTSFSNAFNLTDVVEIVDYFTSNEINYVNSTMDDYISDNSITGNYLRYISADGTGACTCYYLDLGNSTLDSISYVDGHNGITFNFTGNITCYSCYAIDDDSDYSEVDIDSSYDSIIRRVMSNNFDTVFTYSSNAIFTEPSSPTPTPGGLYASILAIMTAMLGFIPTIINGLWAITLIQFVILASLSVSIIYFVIKLLKGFTGNKLNGKKSKK